MQSGTNVSCSQHVDLKHSCVCLLQQDAVRALVWVSRSELLQYIRCYMVVTFCPSGTL